MTNNVALTGDFKRKLNIASSGAGQVCGIIYHNDPANFMALNSCVVCLKKKGFPWFWM